MTALTHLQSRPAHEQAISATGSLKQTYEQLLSSDDAQPLARTFLLAQLQQAANLPQDMPQDLSALQDFVEQRAAEVARQYADYLKALKAEACGSSSATRLMPFFSCNPAQNHVVIYRKRLVEPGLLVTRIGPSIGGIVASAGAP